MDEISIKFHRNMEFNLISALWLSLEQELKPNWFLQWNWIGTWLNSLEQDYTVVVAKNDVQVIGLGIFVDKNVFRNGFVFAKQLYLHRTGEADLDQVWIEYNDFLIHPEYDASLRKKIIQAAYKELKFDELHIGVTTEDVIKKSQVDFLSVKHIINSTTYQLDLDKVRTSGQSLLAKLSRNTRQQLRRSLKHFEQYGELKVEKLTDQTQANQWLENIALLHIKRWEHTDVGSGFNNSKFIEFHNQLIAKCLSTGEVDILKVTAGQTLIGYLYNFIEGATVRFYLSAINYEFDDKFRPGMLAHYLAIEKYKSAGKNLYDFMAGDYRYKQSFSSKIYPVYYAIFQKKSLNLLVESFLKKQYRASKCTKPIDSGVSGHYLITGGQNNHAKCVSLRISNGQVNVIPVKAYVSPSCNRAEQTLVTYKAGFTTPSELILPTETEVISYSTDLKTENFCLSHPMFNDVHHAIRRQNGNLAVVSTGLETILEFNSKNELVATWPVIGHAQVKDRFEQDIDYRKVKSTKPHIAHANYCFELNGKLWVTRCDLMDAICVEQPELRINIGAGLVHDGVVLNNHIYFTTVNGYIKIFDTTDFSLYQVIDLRQFFSESDIGWCRGILPINKSTVVMGITASRQSKRQPSTYNAKGTRVVCLDLIKKVVLWEVDLQAYGLDTVFSILPEHSGGGL